MDNGQLSRAASQLGSRGVAERAVETHAAVEKLLAPAAANEALAAAEAPPALVEAQVVLKTLLDTPKGLAPGPSGLRTEHLRTVLDDRKPSSEPDLVARCPSALRGLPHPGQVAGLAVLAARFCR